jgi:hypothetical protein
MAVELNFVDELTNLGNTKNKEINDGYNIADEERGGSFADISVDQQRQVDTGIDALLYAGLFDTTERKQEADDDDDDNVVGDWEPGNYLVVEGGVAENNDQEIAANIKGKEDSEDFNYEGEKGVDNKLNNLCNQDDTYDDVSLDVGGDVAGNNDQEMAAQLEAETPGKIWCKKLSIVQQCQVDTGNDALPYARCTAAA